MQALPQPSDQTRAAYEALVESLQDAAPVRAGSMFGMPALTVSRKSFGGLFGDALVVKLTGVEHADALNVPGSELFDPSGTGRAMKQWVVIPAEARSTWETWARLALRDLLASG